MSKVTCPFDTVYGDKSVSEFMAMAGDDYMWSGAKGGSEQNSHIKRLIRADLAERQGYVCPVCGDAFTRIDIDTLRVEANHGVSQGPAKKGWYPGNVWTGHKSCNAATAPIYDDEGNLIGGQEVLEATDLARPDVVPMEWTPLPALKRAAGWRQNAKGALVPPT